MLVLSLLSVDEELNDILVSTKDKMSKKKNEPVPVSYADILMKALEVTPAMKAINMQYWSIMLGHCWEKLVATVFIQQCPGRVAPKDTICDIYLGHYGVELKYRFPQADGDILRGAKRNADAIIANNQVPVMLILRTDNHPRTIERLQEFGWEVYEGNAAFEWIQKETGFNLRKYLTSTADNGIMYIDDERG
jgi:hypothetical protein